MTAYTDMSQEELPDGFYYIKLVDGEIRTDCYEGGYGFIRTSENDIEKILSPVPSYKEYLESKAHRAVYSEENKQLKDLLKECLVYIPYSYSQFQTEKRIDLDSAKLSLLTRINAAIGESEE